MNILVEYKNTSKSKFTFTINEIRIKIAEKDREYEQDFFLKATQIYNVLVDAKWTGITLRGNAHHNKSLLLNDSYKNKIALVADNTVTWISEKGTR